MKRGAHIKGMAGEIAESTRVGPPWRSAHTPRNGGTARAYPNELVATARQLERLLQQRRKLRRDLRRVDAHIKHERKMLKALAGAEQREDL